MQVSDNTHENAFPPISTVLSREFPYSTLQSAVPWERDHVGRYAKGAGRPRSQEKTQANKNGEV
jgi:hypothetical protein